MAWVYILRCADDSLYVGATTDLTGRIADHQAGKGGTYTSRRCPVVLVHSEEFSDLPSLTLPNVRVSYGWQAKQAKVAPHSPIKSAAVSRQIFVSYSRKDAEIVRPLVHLLRATNDWVFLDSDSIRAGKKWRQEIDNAISAASLMIVFWCEHSEKSEEVKREYAAAIDTQKDVLPVWSPCDSSKDVMSPFRRPLRRVPGRARKPRPKSSTTKCVAGWASSPSSSIDVLL